RWCGTEFSSHHADSTRNEVKMVFRSNNRNEYPGFTCTASAYDTNAPPTVAPTVAPTEPQTCSCGRVNRASRIIGGIETEVNEYPWQVALLSSASSTRPFCGGSIINEWWIMTAAHCAD
ncbi:unnamed protein product, partial [Meganyctiphanes norvegica]